MWFLESWLVVRAGPIYSKCESNAYDVIPFLLSQSTQSLRRTAISDDTAWTFAWSLKGGICAIHGQCHLAVERQEFSVPATHTSRGRCPTLPGMALHTGLISEKPIRTELYPYLIVRSGQEEMQHGLRRDDR